MKRMIHMLLVTLLLFAASLSSAEDSAAAADKSVQFEGSFYRKLGKQIYFGEAVESGRLKADPDTFLVHGKKEFDFQYLTPMGADKDAFFLATKRIPFPNAYKVKILAPNNNGDCMYLVVHANRLLRINKNQRSVEPVNGKADIATLSPVATNSRYLAPLYFRDKRAVYFYDLHKNTLKTLPKAEPKTFEGRAVKYGFNLYWGMDKHHAYAGYKLIDKAHRPTFEYVGWIYAKDKQRVYAISNTEWTVIPDADPKSFQMVKGRGIDACDNKNDYRMGRKIK